MCSVAGQQSTSSITWVLPGRSFVDHSTKLILTNLSYQDAGVYSCIVANVSDGMEMFTSSVMFTVKQGSKINIKPD